LDWVQEVSAKGFPILDRVSVSSEEKIIFFVLRAYSADSGHMFLDGPRARARDAVHIVFAAEKVRPDYAAPAPDVSESEHTETFRLLSLEALVRIVRATYS
jgi:hypothetical protein